MKKKLLLSQMVRMLKMHRIIAFFLIIFTPILTANAQFFDELSNPKVILNLTHPPGLGLKLNKIAFGPATGNCADQIITALISDFTNSKIEVIDRENLTTILSEHDFTLSGYVNQSSAAAIGKIIGPSALVFVKVQRCETKQAKLYDRESKFNYTTKQTETVLAYYSKTTAFLKASIQTVDLATGRIFSAQMLDYSPERSNKSYDGYPEAPADFDVQEIAFGMLVNDVHRMFLPWTEKTELIYYDDKKCNLKQAFEAVKAGDLDQAFNLSKQNLETCKNTPDVKDKILAHANYNMGMSYMIRNDNDKALEYFREAARLRPGGIVTKAIGDCQRAKDLMAAMQKIDEKASFEADKNQSAIDKKAKEETASTLTNANIIELSQKKLPNSIILQKIKNSKCNFDTSTDALVALTNAGVSEEVISSMIEKGK
jgi:tetratricopeptide (TPR) repeat protein